MKKMLTTSPSNHDNNAAIGIVQKNPIKPERYPFVDGLRGWAAFIVMLIHVFVGSLPPTNFWSDLKMGSWFYFDSRYMVCLFFVVSGFALSNRYIASGNRSIVLRLAGGRYFRLLIPIFATCFLVTILLWLGLFPEPHSRIASYRTHYNFDPSLLNLFRFSFFDVFFAYDSATTYAGPLWTMAYELIGSYLLLLALLIAPGRAGRMAIGITATAYLLHIGSYYSLFFAGALAAELFILARNNDYLSGRVIALISTLLIMIGYGLSHIDIANVTLFLVSVSLFFVGCIFNRAARAFLEFGFSQFLGRISFPLYLIHEAMIVAIGIPLYVASNGAWGRLFAGLLAAAASIILATAAQPIEDASKEWAGSIGRLFEKGVSMVFQRPKSSN